MAANLIVGFSAAGSVPGLGSGLQSNPAAADGGLPGGFAKLLTSLLKSAGLPEADAAAAAALAFAPEAVEDLALAELPAAPGAVKPEFTVPAVPEVLAADPQKLPTAVAPLLLDLVRALTALDSAPPSGEQVDPLLRQQLDDALEALAAYLELPPAATAKVASPLTAQLPPVAAAAEPALPAGLPPAAGPPSAPPALPLPAAAAAPKAAEAATPPAVPPAPLLARLAEKLRSIGETLETADPKLSVRLQAVAERLVSGHVDPQKLAAIGLDAQIPDAPLTKALALLLQPAPEPKPAPAPLPFTTPTLALPPEVAAPRSERPALQTPSRPTAAAPAAPEPQQTETAPSNRSDRAAPEASAPPRPAAASPPAPRDPATAEPKPLPAAAAAPAVAVAATVAAGTKTVHAAYQSPPQQLNLPQVAFEMVRQFQAGHSRFQIRLDPPELGRIDVRMEVDRDGNVTARMTVERSETLDLMQRDQRALERALAQAGLDSARTSLEFSLRQQGSGREQRESGGEPRFTDASGRTAAETEAAPASTVTHHRGLVSPSGVNLFV